ncbi:MAG: HEPN domain-containing protein [Anaerolineae bacterium]|nr:HEPN domain-containing protein [Anaerolineae bacterium]
MRDQVSPIKQWMALAEQALATAQVDLDAGDWRATVNRAYYAIFYSANAALLTKGLERRRHSGVISAFREHLVKPGLIEAEYSNIYGETLVVREDADYAVEIPVDADMAQVAISQARRFVQRIEKYLDEIGCQSETLD